MFCSTVGYFYLDSWILANIIQLGTQRFCFRFLNQRNDPCGRQFDQMTQAARSGVANIAEGSSRRETSKETEMRLTDVARANLAELAGDYINWLLMSQKSPWAKDSQEAKQILSIHLDSPNYLNDVAHDACEHILQQQKKFVQWIDSSDDITAANYLLLLIGRTINMLNKQMNAQQEKFKANGGFREKLTEVRLTQKVKEENGPTCPDCGKPMTRRMAKAGRNSGKEFWGCTGYPDCKGILNIT